jgi:ubiquinol-cytochrome c reductase cytochrome b subunit
MKNKENITKRLKRSVIDLPTPPNISSLWNSGFLLGSVVSIQLVTGLILSIRYINNTTDAFISTDSILRNSWRGWVNRFIHINLASILFILLFTHIARGLHNKSPSKNNHTWGRGIVILVMFIGSAFLGYVLPWGQISFWGATVITNIFSAIPYIGQSSVKWIWGRFSVSQPTLNRFFSLHFLVPLTAIIIIILHLILLHRKGSSSQTNNQTNIDKVKFNVLFSIKDLNTATILFTGTLVVVMLIPKIATDRENRNLANPINAPIHIQPEWYFLFAYAILRSIPSKLGGVVALLASIIILAYPMKKKITTKSSPKEKKILWLTTATFLTLTWIGRNPIEQPIEKTGQISRIAYFILLIEV